MIISVEIKNVYGAEKIYPACNTSKLFADIAGTKTLTRNVLQKIKNLGYSIDVVLAEVQL
jgi:ATP phosphoribosyltransferase